MQTEAYLASICTCVVARPSPGCFHQYLQCVSNILSAGIYCVFNKDQSGASATCGTHYVQNTPFTSAYLSLAMVTIVTPMQFSITSHSTASASSVTSNTFTSPPSSPAQSTSIALPSVTSSPMDHISDKVFIGVVVPLGLLLLLCAFYTFSGFV